MDKITRDENPILFEYFLKQLDDFFRMFAKEFIIMEHSPELRFVVVEGKRLLQQKVLVKACLDRVVKWKGFFYHQREEWVWMFVPTVIEE